MDGWSVDPDRVLGVLAGIDDEGAKLASAAAAIDELAHRGAAALRVDGRTAVVQAWQVLLEERRLVPGKLIHVLSSSAAALTTATVAVITGDEEMARDSADAQARALEEWGIDSVAAHIDGRLR